MPTALTRGKRPRVTVVASLPATVATALFADAEFHRDGLGGAIERLFLAATRQPGHGPSPPTPGEAPS